jgi:hypothetical protein
MGPERSRERHERTGGSGQAPTDAGRTSGGGSLGHAPSGDELEESDIRNNPKPRDDNDDPVLPSRDPALGTKI